MGEKKSPLISRTGNTERKQAEESLQRARVDLEKQLASYRSIFEAGSEGYLVHDDGIIIEVNPQLEELTGYKSSELTGQSFMKLVAEESRPLVAERLRTRPRISFEIVGLKKDGTRIQLEVVGKAHLHEGREVGVVTVRDITERKEAEAALRESAAWLELAEAAGGVGTFDWDIEKNTAKCSDQYFRLFGLNPQPGVSLEEFLELVHEDDVERVREAVENTLERDAPYATDYRVRWPDGSIHWVSDRARVIKDDAGRPVRFYGAITDITERKQAEEALRLQSEILQNMTEAVYLIRASDGAIVYTNPSFEQLFGYGRREMLGKHVSSVNAPTDKSPEETAEEIITALDSDGVWSGEILNIKKDGTLFWCHANVSAFDHTEHGNVWVSYHLDITERKEAEQALQQLREELEIKVEADVLRGNSYGLTFRELTVLHLVAAGRADKEIAGELGISPDTARQHVRNIRSKMHAPSRTDAGVRAVREGIIE